MSLVGRTHTRADVAELAAQFAALPLTARRTHAGRFREQLGHLCSGYPERSRAWEELFAPQLATGRRRAMAPAPARRRRR